MNEVCVKNKNRLVKNGFSLDCDGYMNNLMVHTCILGPIGEAVRGSEESGS